MLEAVSRTEEDEFGVRYRRLDGELEGKKILKRKVFRHAAQMEPSPQEERHPLSAAILLLP
jgi:hypothetical protein